ncbi:DUF3086 domain-containing protein [Spirulina subsalsa FACHB-351]|uniref:DUF3086 domain-containing protein n=1 Tax=Spirulina subsalsa FACHB-351 TaxID=234711 RepID=A0ABT3L4E6_9CYAN|nr:DUF3086 domain-containing protein [Spirulina subsalsa]MCW6036374.1 DUF3086 domain-containing protein [Spirulina subsalsa FACHB-351]
MNSDETQIPKPLSDSEFYEETTPDVTEESTGSQNLQPLPELTPVGVKPQGGENQPPLQDFAKLDRESTSEDAPNSLVGSELNEMDLEAVYEQTEPPIPPMPPTDLEQEVRDLERQKAQLEAEVAALRAEKQRWLEGETQPIQQVIEQMMREGLKELESQKQALQASVEQLEKRRDRISQEMRRSFAGTSQEIAIRVQGFKEYLVGSLQDLAAAAEQLDLPNYQNRDIPPDTGRRSPRGEMPEEVPTPQFAKQNFLDQRRQVTAILDQYRTKPDYYGPPWQLRRTFEPIHAERVQDWFFKQGGRGAIRSMGSRLQNILVASAVIGVLHSVYRDRLRVLVLANTPERLGEWRRGLQDCLGISRSDFGPSRGIGLFESPEALVQKAERLVEDKLLPVIIMDETEDLINLSLLQFPLWLAFARDPNQSSSYLY